MQPQPVSVACSAQYSGDIFFKKCCGQQSSTFNKQKEIGRRYSRSLNAAGPPLSAGRNPINLQFFSLPAKISAWIFGPVVAFVCRRARIR